MYSKFVVEKNNNMSHSAHDDVTKSTATSFEPWKVAAPDHWGVANDRRFLKRDWCSCCTSRRWSQLRPEVACSAVNVTGDCVVSDSIEQWWTWNNAILAKRVGVTELCVCFFSPSSRHSISRVQNQTHDVEQRQSYFFCAGHRHCTWIRVRNIFLYGSSWGKELSSAQWPYSTVALWRIKRSSWE